MKIASKSTANSISQEIYFQAQAELEYKLETMIAELKQMAQSVSGIRNQLYAQTGLHDWDGMDLEDKVLHLCAAMEQTAHQMLND